MKRVSIPAFPISTGNVIHERGMTLRDYFAAAALTGFISNNTSSTNAVIWSYEAADKMLAQREK